MSTLLNGIDTTALNAFTNNVQGDPRQGEIRFAVQSHWLGGTRSAATVREYRLGGATHERDFTIHADEPTELLGHNEAPNPQELLLAALNACMIVGFAANAALMGIELNALEIRTRGALDLRGFLGLDAAVNPGYDAVSVDVIIRSAAEQQQLEQLFAQVLDTSPNFNNFRRSIGVTPTLTVGRAAATV